MKTSDFPSAAPLTGEEPAGVVQDETNVQAETLAISSIVPLLPAVKVGAGAYTEGFSSIAMGSGETVAVGSTSTMAIGSGATVVGSLPLVIGSPTYVNGSYMVAVGQYSFASGGINRSTMLGPQQECDASFVTGIGSQNLLGNANQVAIGRGIQTDVDTAENSVFIGSGFTTVEPAFSVAIGHAYTGCYGPYCVVIGQTSKVVYRGVTVGFYSGFNSVPYSEAGESGIAIGTHNYLPHGPAVAIGYDCLAVYAGVALGICLAATETVAIGYSCNGASTRAVAIGSDITTNNPGTVLGSQSTNYQNYSMVLGAQLSDPAIGGTFVHAGVPASSVLRPVIFHQKLIGGTVSPKEATAGWGGDGYTATVTYDTPGYAGNSFVLNVVENDANSPLAISFDGTNLDILLATDDPSTNTLLNIAALFPSNGFSFSYTSGFDASILAATLVNNFGNGTDGSPTTVLTCDGSGPSISNLPAIYANSLATVTGTVTGVTPDLFESTGDAASFTLAPVIVVRRSVSYGFIGTPTFTMTSNTEGAADWDVPALTTAEDATLLEVAVTNTDADVNWMAHLVFEASQNDIP